jgi:hypothetical protein
MRKKNAGAERCNKSDINSNIGNPPYRPRPSGPDKSSMFQDGFVASGKWFRCTAIGDGTIRRGRAVILCAGSDRAETEASTSGRRSRNGIKSKAE